MIKALETACIVAFWAIVLSVAYGMGYSNGFEDANNARLHVQENKR